MECQVMSRKTGVNIEKSFCLNKIIEYISTITFFASTGKISSDKKEQISFDNEINELIKDNVEIIHVTSYYTKILFIFMKTTTQLFAIEMNSNVKKIVSYELNSLAVIVLDMDLRNRKIFNLQLYSKDNRENIYISFDENNTKAIKFFRDLNKQLMTNKLNLLVNCDENKT